MGQDAISADVAARVAAVIPERAPICVGFSGGLDSTVLLDVLGELGPQTGRKVTALHVHHGLSPNAQTWVSFCERFCANHGVALAVERVHVDPHSPAGTEAAARMARYACFAARPEPFIALAHHLDDQAETVLLQMLRGTGLKGVAAMPELRPLMGSGKQVFRPLLRYPRAQLRAHAEARGLRWIEDESNASTQPERNFLRHDVAPLLDARCPGWQEALARFARHAGSASELLEALATLDGVPQQAGEAFALDSTLTQERRANALRAFLARNAVAMPSEARLAEMARQLFDSRADARVRIDHGGVSILRHRGAAMIERGLGGASAAAWRVDWRQEARVALGAGRGEVHFEPAVGAGIAAAATRAEGWYFAPRAGGESMRLEGADRPTRTLKNLLQERGVPAWQREGLPLLFHGDKLVWVPGVGVAHEYACPSAEAGVVPHWTEPSPAPAPRL